MSLFETHAQRTTFTYNICPNGAAGDWYWEVTCGGHVVARGLAATQVEARADAILSARAYPTATEPSRAPALGMSE
jgi:hypothetical protein